MTEPANPRPVVALDLDGVLNRLLPPSDPSRQREEAEAVAMLTGQPLPDGWKPTAWPTLEEVAVDGWELHEVHIPVFDEDGTRLLPESRYLRGRGEEPLDVAVLLNPSLHAPWINRLREVADVVWATTWEQAANYAIAPLLGIEPLPLGISTVEHGTLQSGGSVVDWKMRALTRAFPGRHLVWVDDMTPGMGWRRADEASTLVVVTWPSEGLTAEQMADVDEFVADPVAWPAERDAEHAAIVAAANKAD